MALRDMLEGIFGRKKKPEEQPKKSRKTSRKSKTRKKPTRKKKPTKKTEKKPKETPTIKPSDKLPLKILVLQKPDEVEEIPRILKYSPLILLSIRDFRKKDKSSLKKTLESLKTSCSKSGHRTALLDENWAVAISKGVKLVK